MTSDLLSLGWAAIDWIEHYLVHGPGDVQGQPIELDDEYAGFIVKAYRVHPRSGEKSVRRAFLSRPKGRAKSELAGMLDCFEALGPCRFDHWAEAGEISGWGYEYAEGEPVGAPLQYVEILNVATEEGQAGNTYDNAYFMLHPDTCAPELLADYGKIDVGLTRINLPNRRGFIEPVTASNESKDGGKSTFIVADETHLWIPPATGKFKLGKMHQTMARNLLKRKLASGWMLETSTMYATGEHSVAEGTHAYAKSPAGKGGRLLFDHRQASDGYDLTKRQDRVRALREVYGPAAAWMPLVEIAASYDDPQVKPNEWERFWLNRPVVITDDEEPVDGLNMDVWAAGSSDVLEPASLSPVAFGVTVTPDRGRALVCVAGQRPDGRVQVAVAAEGPGTAWVTNWLPARVETYQPVVIVLDGLAAALEIPLSDRELPVKTTTTTDRARAGAAFWDAFHAGSITNTAQSALTDSARTSERKFLSEGFVWAGPQSAPLAGVTLAYYGLTTTPAAQKTPEPFVLFGS